MAAINDSSAYKIEENEEYGVSVPDFEGSAAPAVEVPEYAEPSADEIYVYEHEARRGSAILHEINQKKQRRKTKNGILLKVSVLLALGLIIGVRFASITEINYRNQSLQKQLDTVNAEVQRRQVELDMSMSLTELASVAENRLGMQKPQQYQIRYVDVERIDQTELANVELTRTDEDESWIDQVYNAVLRFLGIVK
jgi:hypothetical protein